VEPVFNLETKNCLVSDPRPTNPYGKLYTVAYLGNMVGGQPTLYNNQPIETLMAAAAKQIQSGDPVWFGCDVGKHFNRKLGLNNLNCYDYELLFGVSVNTNMSKAERLIYGDSLMTHAMVLTAVTLDDNGLPTRWRVENSWGDDNGDKGYLAMSNDWFREFVYEVVVDSKHLTDDVLSVFKQEATVLPAWDPMGSLA